MTSEGGADDDNQGLLAERPTNERNGRLYAAKPGSQERKDFEALMLRAATIEYYRQCGTIL